MCGSWDWADNEQERQNNFVHTALLQGRLLDVGAAEQDLFVHLQVQLRGSALERCGWHRWLAPPSTAIQLYGLATALDGWVGISVYLKELPF